MRSLTIRVTTQLSARVSRLAKARHVSQSTVVREALEAYADDADAGFMKRWGHFAGVVKDAPADLSTNKKRMRGYGK